jgi:hypothetical protein
MTKRRDGKNRGQKVKKDKKKQNEVEIRFSGISTEA